MTTQKICNLTMVALVLGLSCYAGFAQSVRRLQVAPGQAKSTARGRIKGSADMTYVIRAVKGQSLQAHLTVGRDEYASLLITGPGKIRLQNADGSDAADDFKVTIPRTGDYRIVIFPPDTAGKNDVAHYTLEVTLK
jgi:hypothetical protein